MKYEVQGCPPEPSIFFTDLAIGKAFMWAGDSRRWLKLNNWRAWNLDDDCIIDGKSLRKGVKVRNVLTAEITLT